MKVGVTGETDGAGFIPTGEGFVPMDTDQVCTMQLVNGSGVSCSPAYDPASNGKGRCSRRGTMGPQPDLARHQRFRRLVANGVKCISNYS